MIVDNNKIDLFGNNIKKVKVRNAGVDMTRIVSMYSIIVQHCLGHGRAIKKFSKYKVLTLMSYTFFLMLVLMH